MKVIEYIESYCSISSYFRYSNAICSHRNLEIFNSHPDMTVIKMLYVHSNFKKKHIYDNLQSLLYSKSEPKNWLQDNNWNCTSKQILETGGQFIQIRKVFKGSKYYNNVRMFVPWH